MPKPLFEVCVDCYESAKAAQNGGADRLELCANLVIGGTTPSEFLFSQIHRDLTVPVNVLIRPRFGDFLYTRQEVAQTADGELDVPNLVRLKQAAGAMDVTLHRAFDMVKDQKRALEQAIHLGFTTILTSGGQGSALKGRENLAELNALAGDQIRLMAGAGVNAANIPELYRATGITAYHGSCRVGSLDSAMGYRNPNVNMGLPGLSEYTLLRTDEQEVRRCVAAVRNL